MRNGLKSSIHIHIKIILLLKVKNFYKRYNQTNIISGNGTASSEITSFPRADWPNLSRKYISATEEPINTVPAKSKLKKIFLMFSIYN